MKIRARLYLFAGAATILLSLVVGGGLWGQSRLGAELQTASQNTHALHAQGTADMMHDALRADVLSALLAGIGRDSRAIDTARADVQEHGDLLLSSLTTARATIPDQGLRQRIDQAMPVAQGYYAAARAMVDRVATGDATAGAAFPAFMRSFELLEKDLGAISQAINERVQTAERQATLQRERTQWALIVLSLLAGGGLLALLAISGRGLLRLLGDEPEELEAAIARLAAGDLGQPVVCAPGDQSSIKAMLARLQHSLQSAVEHIRQTTGEVLQQSHSLAQASESISRAADQQSQSASAMAAAVEEVTVAIGQVAGSCDEALEVSQQSHARAQQGAQVIRGAGQDMEGVADVVRGSSQTLQRLEQESDRISGIVAVIREVADQTNLLALNAAIEAARAGESGRGFAVVADEVRKLAERTATSTREITEMIGAVRLSTQQASASMGEAVERVHAGSGRASEAASAIHGMDESASIVQRTIQDIVLAMREQRQASLDIAGNVERIAHMLENSSSAIHEVAHASDELRTMAHQLQAAVAHFRF